MTEQQTGELDLSFLNQRLSPSRGEYLPVVIENFPLLLQAFDRYGLKGFSQERSVSAPPVTMPYGEENRPVYKEVSKSLADATARGQSERERFLYRLRATALTTLAFVTGEDEGMGQFVDDVENKRVPESMLISGWNKLERLRGVSSALRDLYKVMDDVVREETGKI